MTEHEIKWASQHDWYMGACACGVTAYDSELGHNKWFDNFTELKVWAGY